MNSIDNISLGSKDRSLHSSHFKSMISHDDYKSLDNVTLHSLNVRNTQSFNEDTMKSSFHRSKFSCFSYDHLDPLLRHDHSI